LEGAEKELAYLRSLLDLDKKRESPTLLNTRDDKHQLMKDKSLREEPITQTKDEFAKNIDDLTVL